MNFIARFLRASGRILLSIAAVLAVGFTILLLPLPENQTPATPEGCDPIIKTPTTPIANVDSGNNVIFGLLAFALSALVIFGLYKSLRQYNGAIRRAISKFSHFIKCSIYAAELILTTVFWAIAVALAFFFSPYIAAVMLFAMIANLLCFVFAWLCYGQPVYAL